MLNLLAITMLVWSSPVPALGARFQGHHLAMQQSASHQLTPKERAWFKRAVEDILENRGVISSQDADALRPR